MNFFPVPKNTNLAPRSQERIIRRQFSDDNSMIRTTSCIDLGNNAKHYEGLDIPNTPRKADRAVYAKQLHDMGRHANEIALLLDMSVSYVYRLIRE